MIDISKLSKAKVLVALYNNSKQQGMGFLDPRGKQPLFSEEEAEAFLKEQTYFDYFRGRVLKIDLSKDQLDPRLYDRDNGPGAAEQAIMAIR